MNRRRFIIQASLFAAGSTLSFRAALARRNLEITPLRRNVGIYTGQGGTIGWLAAQDGFAIVDSQFPEPAKECLQGLQKRTSRPLDLLVNTHHHGDHTSGNPVFKDVAGEIVAHRNVPDLMKKSAEENEDAAEPVYPTTTYSGSWKTDLGDETVHLTYNGPAHTSGDSVIYFEKANIAHMGDLVFNRMNPYTDRPAGASIHNWIEVLKAAENDYPADAIYIFGHGKPEAGVTGSREDVAVMRNYLTALVEHVEEGVEQGKSRKEILSLKSVRGFEEFRYFDWWKLSDNLGVIYEEIMEKRK